MKSKKAKTLDQTTRQHNFLVGKQQQYRFVFLKEIAFSETSESEGGLEFSFIFLSKKNSFQNRRKNFQSRASKEAATSHVGADGV
jgi:hypothetical protein